MQGAPFQLCPLTSCLLFLHGGWHFSLHLRATTGSEVPEASRASVLLALVLISLCFCFLTLPLPSSELVAYWNMDCIRSISVYLQWEDGLICNISIFYAVRNHLSKPECPFLWARWIKVPCLRLWSNFKVRSAYLYLLYQKWGKSNYKSVVF